MIQRSRPIGTANPGQPS